MTGTRSGIGFAAVMLIVAMTGNGRTPQSPDLQQYRRLLAGLDPSTPECLTTARQALVTRFTPGHPDGEQALRAFRQYYLARMKEQNAVFETPRVGELLVGTVMASGPRVDSLMPLEALARLKGPLGDDLRHRYASEVELLRRTLRWPFELDESEGFWFLNADAAWLAQPARQIACPLGDLLIFLSGERPTRVVDDASLRLTWAELGERIVRWDRFARTHADLPETSADVTPTLKGYLFCYLCGLDNSQAYDRNTHALDPALRASYERFVAKSRDWSAWAYVDGLVKLLGQQGFRRTAAVEQYLNRADSPAPCGRFRIPGPRR
jgi:hypothetical protein